VYAVVDQIVPPGGLTFKAGDHYIAYRIDFVLLPAGLAWSEPTARPDLKGEPWDYTVISAALEPPGRNEIGASVADRVRAQRALLADEVTRQTIAQAEREIDALPPQGADRIGDAAARKATPLTTGCLDYFPDALLAVAALSKVGNDQHNPGTALHWDRAKSGDEADALSRHLIDRGTLDTDGQRHSAKVAWRALALLQKEIEASRGE
jgi:hypothetical protein